MLYRKLLIFYPLIDHRSQLTQGRKVLLTLEMISKLVRRVITDHVSFFSEIFHSFFYISVNRNESSMRKSYSEPNFVMTYYLILVWLSELSLLGLMQLGLISAKLIIILNTKLASCNFFLLKLT